MMLTQNLIHDISNTGISYENSRPEIVFSDSCLFLVFYTGKVHLFGCFSLFAHFVCKQVYGFHT